MATGARKSAFYRGNAGRAKGEEELARQKARAEARKEQGLQPFRFRVPVGGTTQFVILDDAPDFFRFEHNLKNPQTGFWDTFTGCVKEWDNCPVCAAVDRDSYYALYFTVLDFTEFKTKDGQKHEFSRKLLVVKPAQQKKFQRAFSKAEKDGRTLRGAVFEVTRDGEKDSSIGNDIELVDWMEEDELVTYTRSWKDKEGKKHTEDCSVSYEYEKMFEEPDSDNLRAIVGASPAPGSRAHEEKELGRRPSRGRKVADDEDDEEYEPAERKGRMSASRKAKDEDDEEEEKPVRRSVGRGKPREDDEEEEKPARRSVARSKVDDAEEETPRRPSRGRKVDDDPPFDPDEDDDEDKKAPGVGRRVQARGRR